MPFGCYIKTNFSDSTTPTEIVTASLVGKALAVLLDLKSSVLKRQNPPNIPVCWKRTGTSQLANERRHLEKKAMEIHLLKFGNLLWQMIAVFIFNSLNIFIPNFVVVCYFSESIYNCMSFANWNTLGRREGLSLIKALSWRKHCCGSGSGCIRNFMLVGSGSKTGSVLFDTKICIANTIIFISGQKIVFENLEKPCSLKISFFYLAWCRIWSQIMQEWPDR